MNRTKQKGIMLGALAAGMLALMGPASNAEAIDAGVSTGPVRLIYDTDMGNDIDDALALAMIHSLQSRGECVLLAVTTTKDNPLSAPVINAINTFYHRGDIPVGAVQDGVTREEGSFLRPVLKATDDTGEPAFARTLESGAQAPPAVEVLRRALAAQPDGSVVIVQVGFSTNLAHLLASEGDTLSPLNGVDLVRAKCRLLSAMAGHFAAGVHREYNVVQDIASAKTVLEQWPTPVVISGFEIGLAILYPADSILRDYGYVSSHPIRVGYESYMTMPYDRPTWDLTSVLVAVRPDHDYFELSAPGRVTVDAEGLTHFEEDAEGDRRVLQLDQGRIPRILEALTLLSSQPPTRVAPGAKASAAVKALF